MPKRFIPSAKGDVEIEHLHRYHAASDLVRGRRVLDLACGEGDGSAILAGGAGSVVGVDISPEAVAHARATHSSPRLRFEVGSAEQIPLEDGSVDAVVCFETLEHVAAHDQVLAEFRRVLQPGGFLVISCPDRREHSEVTQSRNPFHLLGLYLNEFRDLLGRHFRNVQLYGQQVQYASMLAPLDDHQAPFVSFRSDGSEVVRGKGVVRPVHFLAVASDGPCPPLPAGVLAPQEPPFRAELESLRGALATSEADLARLGARLSEQEDQFRRREQEVRKLGAAGLSAQEARLNATALELRQAARALDSERRTVADLQQRAQDLDAKLRVVWASRSWRLTAPLRKAMSGVRAIHPRRRLRRVSEGLFIFTYRHLPFGNSTRVRLRNSLFRAFPWAFAHTGSFVGLEQNVQQEAANEASTAGTSAVLSPQAVPARRPLPAADGVWEWADGAELRRRISDAETQRREGLRVEPCELISFQEGALDAAVAGLQFPDCAEPLVTILIPTSGNLRSTVECLLSIARGAEIRGPPAHRKRNICWCWGATTTTRPWVRPSSC